jgi:hypothetical protein
MEVAEALDDMILSDITRYKHVLQGMLSDVYAVRPRLAPRLHDLITRCNGLLVLTKRKKEGLEPEHEVKRRIGEQVQELKVLTEEFLVELSEASQEEDEYDSSYRTASAA